MNGANLIIECLKAHHVNTIFGYPGGAIMPTYDAIYDSGLDHLLCRNEQGAAMAAIGYARASGKVGVCIATSGPGATNLVTGLGDALMDSIPIVAITGQVTAPLIGTDAFQEADVFGLSLACTKHSFIVQNIEELPEIIAKAFEIAKSGRPGPGLIDVPKDVQVAPTNAKPIVNPPPKTAALCDKQFAQALALLKHAKRPMAYIGGGVGMAGAVPALRYFLHTTQMPSVVTLKGLGAVSPDDPYYLGMIGMHGTKAANYATQEADLLLVFGARFDDRVTGDLKKFCPQAEIIHVDIDPSSIAKNVVVHIPIVGSVRAVLREMLRQMGDEKADKAQTAAWWQQIEQWRAVNSLHYAKSEDRIKPQQVIETLYKLTGGNAVIASDVGQHQMWVAQYFPFHEPRRWINSGGLGTMGFGYPAAIGAKVARPNEDVFCITGDGSIQMMIQEMTTALQYHIPVKILCLNNGYLGMVRQWQEFFYDKRYSMSYMESLPDFVKLAEAYGHSGVRIEKPQELESKLREVIAMKDKTVFVDIITDPTENVYPMIPAGGGQAEMILGPSCSLNQDGDSQEMVLV